MHYYNAKSKVIMKDASWYYELLGGGKGIAAYPDIFGDSRVGATEWAHQALGGASRGVRGVRGVRRSRRGGQGVIAIKRTFGGGKRSCRSKSRCGGSSWSSSRYYFLGGRRSRGVRGVRRSRRGGRGGAYGADFLNDSGLPRGWF